ncbi:DUF4870 domain-containing protein [Leucobacter sp. OH2974_COT-288]|uniref:DUF4870 domain-containing protein n=1 Tax=Canibacter oris TaxID=1365628 RepID=A0A840DG19_9MICO|nr:DUF4870 domain-containing protein [Canibacter oris]MBB4071994.1 hypothetical protein [Canibacter oris]RRD35225.1 DUF4870 domain-containing protein [Leucobacter sp. OH2974_COT-288]
MSANAQYAAPQYAQPEVTAEERTWSLASHLSILVGLLLSAGLLMWIPALVIYLMKKDESWFVREHSSGSLNFALNMLVWQLIGGLLVVLGIIFLVLVVPLVFLIVGGLILLASYLMSIIFPVMAAIAANNGKPYKYPLTLNLIK